MPELTKVVNTELQQGFTVPQVAEEHGVPEPLVWSIALEGKSDLDRFKALNWELKTVDLWEWTDCLPREIHVNDKQSVFHWGDKRFGDDWPGRLPAQMIAHILYYFSDQGDLVLDPMAGGGVVADTCLAFNRRCWSFDMDDRPDRRPEIEPYFWDITNLKWPIKGKSKPDLVIFDPPYFKKQSNNYDPDGISGLSKEKYLEFLENFFALAHLNTKKSTRLASINSDWPARHRSRAKEAVSPAQGFRSGEAGGRDFENTPAMDEDPEKSIMINDYVTALHKSGWRYTYIISAPLSPERFKGDAGLAMQKKRILGVTGRHVIIAEKK